MSWQSIESAPRGQWIRTRREGEEGENITAWRWDDPFDPSDREWIEKDTGRTTVTHSTFAAPTHWMPLPEPPAALD